MLNAPAISTAIAQQVGHSLSFWCTYHRVVAFIEEAHHLNVCRNRRTSERKRSLLILPSEKEENKVNCASECIRPRIVTRRSYLQKKSPATFLLQEIIICNYLSNYLLNAPAISTAIATVAPTIGLLPMPRKPIISTCAGTDEEPANCASECIRPIVSVIP